MGTEFECAVDHLSASQRNCNFGALNYLDYWALHTKGLKNSNTVTNQFQKTMDRLIEHYDKESARKMILKQEAIFKDQVRELHRIYKVQKRMMADLTNNASNFQMLNNPSSKVKEVRTSYVGADTRTRSFGIETYSETSAVSSKNWNQIAMQTDSSCSQLFSFRTAPSLQGHASTSSEINLGIWKGFELKRPAEETISKAKTCISNSLDLDSDGDIELTLSIGNGSNTKKPKKYNPYSKQGQDSAMFTISEGGEESKALPSRENMQYPPWLFPIQSLNRT